MPQPGEMSCEQAVLNAVVRAAVDRPAVREEWQLARAVAKDVGPGRRRLLNEALIGRRRPHGKTIVARVAGRAILDHAIACIHA